MRLHAKDLLLAAKPRVGDEVREVPVGSRQSRPTKASGIEHRRRQVQRLRGEIRQLKHSGISSASAEALLDRMLIKIDELCAERDRLKKEQPGPNRGKALGGRKGEPSPASV